MLEGTTSGISRIGGLLTTTNLIDNYPGFPEGISGKKLTEQFKKQSIKFGTIILSENIVKLTHHNTFFSVNTEKNIYNTKSIIIASGAIPKKLQIPGFDKFLNNGVNFSGEFDVTEYINKHVVIIGCGDSACSQVLNLIPIVNKIVLLCKHNSMSASRIMQDNISNIPNLEIILNSNIIEICGLQR